MFTFQSSCPLGWIAIRNSCYKVSYANIIQSAAIAMCRDEGGYLAVITSAAERDAIQSILLSDDDVYFYVDGTDAELEGTWKTQTGETMQDVPFQVPSGKFWQEPGGGSSENCLKMDTNQFSDIECDYITSGALCELNLNY